MAASVPTTLPLDQPQPPIKRIVVKIGTSTVCDAAGSPDPTFIASLAAQVDQLRAQGVEAVIVSSGAIRAGLDRLTLPHLPKSIPIKQAAAAVGQSRLMHLYAQAFTPLGMEVAQVLLTRDDFHVRRRYIHAANTLRALLRLAVVPIVNENDTVAVDEIKVGDNDTLAAQVAAMIDADLLILLSDIDGLYTADPGIDPHATLISRVDNIDKVALVATTSRGAYGTGGMRTKIEAARMATRCGIPMVIAHGRSAGILHSAIDGGAGTLFQAHEQRLSARKRWLAGAKNPVGVLIVHPEAVQQVTRHGKSLLAAGVLDVLGSFRAGELVSLNEKNGRTFAQGVASFSHERLQQIKGMRSEQIAQAIGELSGGEVIHRDDLVIVTGERASPV